MPDSNGRDLDAFKQINDTQGHQRGDEVLRSIGRELRCVKRDVDVACRYGGDEFCVLLPNTDADIRYAQSLEAKVAERTRELAELSRIDCLTGLLNTRAFVDECYKEFNRAQRNVTPLAIVYIDLDAFKQINDTQGHQRGDEVLRSIGRELRCVKRDVDVACRYDGDEFCVLLPNTDADGAQEFVGRLEVIEMNVQVRLSIGIAHTGPEEFITLDELLRQADQRMYAMKQCRTQGSME